MRRFSQWARIPAIGFLSIAISSCSDNSIDPYVYKALTPELDVKEFFNGKLKAWGAYYNRQGKLKERFVINIQGKWEGDQGLIE